VSAPPCRVEALPCADPLALPALERELQQRWLVWDAWTAGKRRVDLHPLVLSSAAHHAAIAVAGEAYALVSAAGARAHEDADERARYRFHPDVERLAAAARAAGDRGGVVARVDLLLGADGRFVACEVNADCPGGYNETVALPELARRAGLRRGGGLGVGQLRDPTVVAAALADRLVALSGGPGSPRGVVALVFATGYAEDLQICAFLERLVRERGGRTAKVAPTALSSELGPRNRVLLRGEPVSVLYRFYPLEYMGGQKNVAALARATEAGTLASVSTMAAIYAQSKLAMARAGSGGARSAFPGTVAFAAIGSARLVAEREDWVLKRDLSRVGDHVYVGALTEPGDWAEIVAAVERAETHGGQVWIAQRFAPQAEIATPWGPRLVTLGVYVVDGAFAGYFARLSPTSHCSHDALVVPVFVEEDAPS
jgi:hypothetical protein